MMPCQEPSATGARRAVRDCSVHQRLFGTPETVRYTKDCFPFGTPRTAVHCLFGTVHHGRQYTVCTVRHSTPRTAVHGLYTTVYHGRQYTVCTPGSVHGSTHQGRQTVVHQGWQTVVHQGRTYGSPPGSDIRQYTTGSSNTPYTTGSSNTPYTKDCCPRCTPKTVVPVVPNDCTAGITNDCTAGITNDCTAWYSMTRTVRRGTV